MKMQKERIAYIDVIKVFLTCLVVAHHAGQAYGATGGVWLTQDEPQLAYLKPFFFLNASYMMGFYFFISGYFMYYSLQNKPKFQFIQDRLRRLGIPLLIFTFFLFTPLHYALSDKSVGELEFMVDLYFKRAPLATGHLWFVASLLVYSFIYLIVDKYFINTEGKQLSFKFWYPLLYLAFLIPVNVLIRRHYPIDTWVTWGIPIEVAHLPQYLSLFLLGPLFNKTGWLDKIKLSTSLFYLLLAASAFLFRENLYDTLPKLWSESIIESLLCVGISLGFISLFKIVFTKMNPLLKLISDNSYGIYIFHLLIVIALQIFLKEYAFDSNLKFIIVTVFAIAISCLLTHFLRKNRYIRRVL
ncbi:MAG: acyltransferase [Fulvivirga sp.]|uniref:acyltransferase n=1 Tax=Fulvivirga sp. TaxID=1931237 RepID=UPI0032F0457F